MVRGGSPGKDAERPPWWPEGEAWPPAAPRWRGVRRIFLRRVGFLLAFIILFLFAASMIALRLLFGPWQWEGHPNGGPPEGGAPFGGIFLLIIAIVIVVSLVRRLAGPIGDVMEAAGRVADGDYDVRVNARGSRDMRRLVASFNAMTTRLQANEEQRKHLLSDIAHELRTPLSVVRGNVEGMLDGVYPRDDEHLGPVLEETKVMARLLDDLQTLANAEAGALKLYREPTDVAALVDDVVATFAPRAASKGIQLAAVTADGTDIPDIEVDPVRVREVLENLVANALRHTPSGGQIRIETARAHDTVVFTVVDTGPGIAPDELPHVFERFTKSADSGGSGLGLAIAKSLVEAHGGVITAESELGHGTSVRFTLPFGLE